MPNVWISGAETQQRPEGRKQSENVQKTRKSVTNAVCKFRGTLEYAHTAALALSRVFPRKLQAAKTLSGTSFLLLSAPLRAQFEASEATDQRVRSLPVRALALGT
jgi:hypothetical protein